MYCRIVAQFLQVILLRCVFEFQRISNCSKSEKSSTRLSTSGGIILKVFSECECHLYSLLKKTNAAQRNNNPIPSLQRRSVLALMATRLHKGGGVAMSEPFAQFMHIVYLGKALRHTLASPARRARQKAGISCTSQNKLHLFSLIILLECILSGDEMIQIVDSVLKYFEGICQQVICLVLRVFSFYYFSCHITSETVIILPKNVVGVNFSFFASPIIFISVVSKWKCLLDSL